MGWFFKSRRGPEWKHGWQAQALDSASAPPAPLVAVLCIVLLFLAMSNQMDYRAYVYRRKVRVNSFLLFAPMLVIVVSLLVAQVGSFMNSSRRRYDGDLVSRAGEGSPWLVAGVVILLLVMVSYQPTFQPRLFPV
uniref:Uncharacterized protein n=1 Tax=Kalanchoe fedtschenkoi TaxID=63787 RepID=A0A7N0R9T8_KALFE